MPAELTPWRISGTYLESCNCEAICPCRTIGGRKGGRSTYGICMGTLSWAIVEGSAGDVDLAGLGAALAIRYNDDEPGSPWSFFVYVDERGGANTGGGRGPPWSFFVYVEERGGARQREALEAIFCGRLGGTPEEQFPW